MIAWLVALAAVLTAGTPESAYALAHCTPHVEWGTFVGCEAASTTGDDSLYAGLVWTDGAPSLETGP